MHFVTYMYVLNCTHTRCMYIYTYTAYVKLLLHRVTADSSESQINPKGQNVSVIKMYMLPVGLVT